MTSDALSKSMRDFRATVLHPRSGKPTVYGWLLLVLLALLLYNILFRTTQQSQSRQGKVLSPEQPSHPKEAPHKKRPHVSRSAQDNEFMKVFEDNLRGAKPKIPMFDVNKVIQPAARHKVHVMDVREDSHERGSRRAKPPHPKDFPVPIELSPRLHCTRSHPGVLAILVVFTRPEHAPTRNSIRKTWGRQDPARYPKLAANRWTTVFVMGMSETGYDVDVTAENEAQGDILQGKFPDSEFEDTRKLMLAITWLERHATSCSPHLVLRTQDNIFLNMVAIVHWMEAKFPSQSTAEVYLGKLVKRDTPIRDTKNPLHVPMYDYAARVYPDYVESPVYLLSFTAVSKMVKKSMRSIIPLAKEDAYLGLLAEHSQITPRHNDHYHMLHAKNTDVCHQLRIFFSYKVTPSEHLTLFRRLQMAHKTSLCRDADWLGRDQKRVHLADES